MGERTIKRDDLVRLLEAGKFPGGIRLLDLVTASRPGELVLKPIPVRELLAAYERRRARMPDAHPMSLTVDRLLTALAACKDEEVNVVTLEAPRSLVAVWLTKNADAVLSTLVEEEPIDY